MKIEKKDLGKSKYQIKISLLPEELAGYFQSTYEKLAKDVKISGFRPGKAPRRLVEEAIGQARLFSQSLDLALQQSYVEAIKEERLIPICPPKVTIVKYPKWGLSPEEIEEELIFEVEIEVMPEIKLGDYSGVKIKKKKIAEIKNSDVEKILLHLRRQKATFSDVDRGAKAGDRVEISYEGFIDSVKKDAMSAKNHPLVLGEGTLIPGFEDQIVGMKKGEEKEFEISFPTDYRNPEFAGKKAKFKVKLVELKQINLPELNDQFAQSFGRPNVKDLNAVIEKSLKEEIALKAKNELELEVIEKVLPYLSVEIPNGLIEQEIDRFVARMSEQIKSRGLSLEKYLENIKKSLPDLRRDLRPQAEKNIKIGLLLGKIIEREKLDPQDREAGKKALEILIKEITT